MTNQINKKIMFGILMFISLILFSAFIIEYKLGYKPCKLCIYERIPYFLALLFIIKILVSENFQKLTLFILSLIFFSSSVLAFYHFGIEQGIFSESFVCKTENISEILSKEELLEKLNLNTISCKDVTFKVLGFSLASINTIISILLTILFMRLFINYGKN